METSLKNVEEKEGVGQENEDDELASSNLYEESMAEITFNETRADGTGGHDSDPFDRSGEYDEDVNLEAPPPTTPDIPEVSTDVLISLRNRIIHSEATTDVRNPFEDTDQTKTDEPSVTSNH